MIMFGFGKKEEKEVPKIIKSILKNESLSEYPIRGIYLTDGYNLHRPSIYYTYGNNNFRFDKYGFPIGRNDGIGLREDYFTASSGWTECGEPIKVRLYFLYEGDNDGIGFQYVSWEYTNSGWKRGDIKKIKYYDGESKIVYSYKIFEDYYTDGSTKTRKESGLHQILLNRNVMLPMK